MFIKGIKRAYDQISKDASIADEDKFDALLMRLGQNFLVSNEDRVYIFEYEGKTARFDAKHARAFHFKDYVIKDMNKLFHDFNL
ncbi:hypothetical protein KMZ14_03055 [Acinetobacter schindleri]|uniref:hypothetical protein n=1 Tax=Acinetobacter TaxID=469 RepID=UPI002360D287|nr:MULTISPECIES: hypothetical protein [Acinetobacter]WDE16553.1 hypothetical protein KMZ14_03055 [Acinetobacter schindleri]